MKTILPFAAVAAALLAAPAFAQGGAPAPQVRVISYADLDLASDAGRRQLDRRIAAAVADACGTASDADLHGKNLVGRCRTEAWGQANAQRASALASLDRRGARFASGR